MCLYSIYLDYPNCSLPCSPSRAVAFRRSRHVLASITTRTKRTDISGYLLWKLHTACNSFISPSVIKTRYIYDQPFGTNDISMLLSRVEKFWKQVVVSTLKKVSNGGCCCCFLHGGYFKLFPNFFCCLLHFKLDGLSLNFMNHKMVH